MARVRVLLSSEVPPHVPARGARADSSCRMSKRTCRVLERSSIFPSKQTDPGLLQREPPSSREMARAGAGSFQGSEVKCFRGSKFVAVGESPGWFLCQNVKRVLRKVPWAPSEVSRREIRSSGVPILDLSAGGSFQGPEVMCFRESKFVAIGEFSGLFLCQNVKRALRIVPWAPSEPKRREIRRPESTPDSQLVASPVLRIPSRFPTCPKGEVSRVPKLCVSGSPSS